MDLYNIKILVVEDEEAERRSLVRILSEEFSAISAKDGIDGLAKALRQQPQLILLDISMPKLDGIGMMKKLRESGDWGKKVPVILLTNLSADDRIMRGIVEDEPSFYLLKSEYSPAGVIQKIKEVLGIEKPESNWQKL